MSTRSAARSPRAGVSHQHEIAVGNVSIDLSGVTLTPRRLPDSGPYSH
ncbi:MAG TPA: hypothetical protein VF777_12560 [Phycisphaerales bacterium]